jgi:hypothetical protein
MAMMFAFSMPAILAVSGVAMDAANYNMKKSELQSASDSAAIAAAKEMAIANSTQESIEGAARAYIAQQLSERVNSSTIDVTYDRKTAKVTVRIAETWAPFLAQYFGAAVTPVVTEATAALTGATNVCVLALDESASSAVKLTTNAKMTAPSCAIYANSNTSNGITVDGTGKITADMVCSVGGASYGPGTITPEPTTDCSKLADPLSDRPPPKFGGCDFTDRKIVSGNVTVSPGTYCGGLEIGGLSMVTFQAGTYIIKDGLFKISGLTYSKGKDVGFYLTGANAKLDFTQGASIEFSGRESGDMAGLIFFEDRTNPVHQKHRINTMLTRELTGTIYMPHGDLLIDPSNVKLGDKSAYTAIVVNTLELRDGPELLLNTNYGATKVPVPAGIRSRFC